MNVISTKRKEDKVNTITEMCKMFQVSARTLRFYESKELLFPIRKGQHRLFTKSDRGRMKLIMQGKRLGFSLEEIRQLLNLYNFGDTEKPGKFFSTINAVMQLFFLSDSSLVLA